MKFAIVFIAIFVVSVASSPPGTRRPLRNFQRRQQLQQQHQFQGQYQRQFQQKQNQLRLEQQQQQEQVQQQQQLPLDNLRDIDDPSQAQILRFENDNIGVGPYNYAFETSDGQKREEHGELRHVGTDQEGIAVHGSYSYVVNGVRYTVNYIADENGFRPEGIHIPQSN